MGKVGEGGRVRVRKGEGGRKGPGGRESAREGEMEGAGR